MNKKRVKGKRRGLNSVLVGVFLVFLLSILIFSFGEVSVIDFGDIFSTFSAEDVTGMTIGAAISESDCDSGDFSTTCNISSAKGIDGSQTINANNIVIENGGSFFNSTSIDVTFNLTGNLTIDNGGIINGSGASCSTGICTNGSNITIIADVVNISGILESEGGLTTGNANDRTSGKGGNILIDATTIYLYGNISVDSGQRDSVDKFVGWDAGRVDVNGSSFTIYSGGNISARGGDADSDGCSSNNFGQEGSVGVVSFSSEAFVNNVLSKDFTGVGNVISELEVSVAGGTAIGDAIITSVNVLEGNNKLKTVVLLTDGMSNSGVGLDSAVDYAIENNVVVHTIGFGTLEGGNFSSFSSTINSSVFS